MPVNLKGKTYYQVSERVNAFRTDFPADSGWGITTDLVRLDDHAVCIKASVISADGAVIGTGYAEEVRADRGVNSTSAVENCETSAIGRALAAAGWGTDGEYASANEVEGAIAAQNEGRTYNGAAKRQAEPPTEGQLKFYQSLIKDPAITDEEREQARGYVTEHATKAGYSKIIDRLKALRDERQDAGDEAVKQDLFV